MALVCLLATAAATMRVDSINSLNAAIHAGPVSAVGFLSQGNYDAIASILPKTMDNGGPLAVRIFDNLESLEAAVMSGEVLAGLSTSRPENEDGHLVEFPASLITMRAPMFRENADGNALLDSQKLREALDAATIRAIHQGEYERLETQYFASNQFDSVAAFTCGINPDNFPFPAAADATGLLSRVLNTSTLLVGALGPSDWGYQGNYLEADPPGFWPEYMNAILARFTQAYPGVSIARVFNGTSDGVMDDLKEGRTDVTEIYWTVSGYYQGRARSENFDLGCTVLGTESIFFTNSGSANASALPSWAIGVIAAAAVLVALLLCFVYVMMQAERQGKPIFRRLDDAPKGVTMTHSGNQA